MRSVGGYGETKVQSGTGLDHPKRQLRTPKWDVPNASLGLPTPPPKVKTAALPLGQRLLGLGRGAGRLAIIASVVGASLVLAPPAAHAQPTQECIELAAESSGNEAILQERVCELVWANYDGDPEEAFRAYAGADGAIDRTELSQLLRDAGVGNGATRPWWVNGVMSRIDGNGGDGKNDKIEWLEFSRTMQ